MEEQTLKNLVESFKKSTYKKVTRNDNSYQQLYDFTSQELNRYLEMYSKVVAEDQTAREIRNRIDDLIRRYQKYAIKERHGSHYREAGVVEKNSIFEHVIPQNNIRDMLISGLLTIDQALNSPTCLVKKSSDLILAENGLVTTSPDNWKFFKRYSVLNSTFTTFNGQTIPDIENWTLADHFKMFNID